MSLALTPVSVLYVLASISFVNWVTRLVAACKSRCAFANSSCDSTLFPPPSLLIKRRFEIRDWIREISRT